MKALLRHGEGEVRCYGAFAYAAFGAADGDDFVDVWDGFLFGET